MTITIQTGQFVGLLEDAMPFAFPKDDMPSVNVVRLEWDEEMLHASATDMLRTARSSWHPDDDEKGSDSKKPLIPAYGDLGGADDRWVVFMRLADAKSLAKHFTLPKTDAAVPITLDHNNGRLRVDRSADTGQQAVRVDVETHFVEFPELTKLFDADPTPEPVEEIPYVGRHLGDFCSVRQRGQFVMTFADKITYIHIGERFVGTLRPDRTGQQSGLMVQSAIGTDF